MSATSPNWLLRGWFERPSLALVFGAPGCGKSFLAIDVACCVATGLDFHGLSVERGPVVYVAGEGHGGISRRLKAWSIARRRALDDAELFLTAAPVGLGDPQEVEALDHAVTAVTRAGRAPNLVVVDTLARNFGAGDENSTESMSAFVAACDRIRLAYDCTVLLIHHSGHGSTDRARGNSALTAATDTAFRLVKDRSGVIRVDNVRQKDFELLPPQAFALRTVELGVADDEGIPVTSAVLHSTQYEPCKVQTSRAALGKNQKKALEALRRLSDEGERLRVEAGREEREVRVSAQEWRDACILQGLDRKRFSEARKGLERAGQIETTTGFVRLIA